ncbi:hypothetical protein MNL01_06150 [Bartonella krasnovii]|uniref:hypothetical protein n=1 Tax=Bartonella krasnovii TaxID=2267275 RepID=UPI001F4D2BC8|nr:hypothetical protein [Bartonella krasnovii]UNF53241.1 hypothetical protein MNL01_06150 [Bartonella krasnovii]
MTANLMSAQYQTSINLSRINGSRKETLKKHGRSPLIEEASKTQKMIENVHQNIKRQENIPSHKMQHTKAMTL